MYSRIYSMSYSAFDLPESWAIEGSREDAEEFYYKMWIIISKLLLDLVNFVKLNCPLAQQVSFGFRREGREVDFAWQMVSKILGSFNLGQSITIDDQLTDLIRGSGGGEEHALRFNIIRVGVSALSEMR